MLISDIKSDFALKTFKIRYKETYGMVSAENLEYSLSNSLLW